MSDKMFKNLYLCFDEGAYDYAMYALGDPKNHVEIIYANSIGIMTKEVMDTNNCENCYVLLTTSKGILGFRLGQAEIQPEIKVAFPRPASQVLSRLKLVKAPNSLSKYLKKAK